MFVRWPLLPAVLAFLALHSAAQAANPRLAGVLRLRTSHGTFGGAAISTTVTHTATPSVTTGDGTGLSPTQPPIQLRLGEATRFSFPGWPGGTVHYTGAKLSYPGSEIDLDLANPVWRPDRTGIYIVGVTTDSTWQDASDHGTAETGWLFKVQVAPATRTLRGRLIPQRGIAGLNLGMTKAQVKASVGLPRRMHHSRNDIGRFTTFEYRTYSVTFFGGDRVTSFATTSAKEQTANGVGVGSSRSDVKRLVSGVRCLTEFGYSHCYVGTWKPGRTVTDFAIRDGRVARVTIGYVID